MFIVFNGLTFVAYEFSKVIAFALGIGAQIQLFHVLLKLGVHTLQID